MLAYPYTKSGGKKNSVYWGYSTGATFPTDNGILFANTLTKPVADEVRIPYWDSFGPIILLIPVWTWVLFPLTNPQYPTYVSWHDDDTLVYQTIQGSDFFSKDTVPLNGVVYQIIKSNRKMSAASIWLSKNNV